MSEKIDDFRFVHVSNTYSQNTEGQLVSQVNMKSETDMAVITLEVGVKPSGHASDLAPESITISEFSPSKDFLLPVIVINGIFKTLNNGSKCNSSFVSPELE